MTFVSRCIIIAALVAAAAPLRAQNDGRWITERATLAPGFAGVGDSIGLLAGIALRPDLQLRDGTIEFDIAPPPSDQFAGIAFHAASAADYEILYLRSSNESGRWIEMQYQPVWQGETNWQLYPGPNYSATIPASYRGALHVRLVIAGARADVFLNSDTVPMLRVPQLKRGIVEGAVGFWTSPARNPRANVIRHLSVNGAAPVSLAAVPVETHPATQLMHWQLTRRAPNDSVAPPLDLPPDVRAGTAAWIAAEGEPSGLINLNRYLGNSAGPQTSNVFGGAAWGITYARVRIVSDRAQVRHLAFSYSDGIGVYLRGRRIFTGSNFYDGRYTGFLGYVGPEVDGVDLPLVKGVNDLVLAITDKGFGWGFRAKLDSLDSLIVR